jgi:hypothetical protein
MALLLLLVHADAALLGHRRRVDAVHILRALQQPGDGRVAHQFGLGLGQRAAVDQIDGLDAALARLRQERAQPPGQIDVRRQHNILLVAQRGQIHRILHHAELEILAHLPRNLDAHRLLRLAVDPAMCGVRITLSSSA